ncbi:MAG: hypothetical protein A3G34_16840 [Candidatus Lindowbacteria bacterium RIFCSPLOWO2_12_FULL_62_27]|nr:MAG: hypothetical protein A3G34_16840 [Candidatus Lindowbacteria bacterium RIFCSPLOWO2_12_FULL_62_27]
MGSFSCPHFDIALDHCLLLDTACVPGRAGCVLRSTSKFLIPAEERMQSKPDTGRAKHRGNRKGAAKSKKWIGLTDFLKEK